MNMACRDNGTERLLRGTVISLKEITVTIEATGRYMNILATSHKKRQLYLEATKAYMNIEYRAVPRGYRKVQ
jgi:hypothetical protein